jgi:hypothetical protein
MSDLNFDWEAVADKTVEAVIGRCERRMTDGSLAWEALALAIGRDAIVLTVTADTDEINVSREPAPEGDDWMAVPALGEIVGRPLGWCWVATNSRGYRDSFTLAFGDPATHALRPRLTILAEASSLTCFDLTPLKA